MDNNGQSIRCHFTSETALYLAYMSFIKDGGLFIRTKNAYELGSEVNLSIQLINEPEQYQTPATVVWITPKGAQGNKPVGIGVQFTGENAKIICNKIETLLAGLINSTQPTDTM